MNKKKAKKIVFLLDETGSMYPVKSDTIGGFNMFLHNQKNSGNKIKLTLTSFNGSKIEKRYINEPIENVEPFTEESYNPTNSTPLYDAIGKTIEEFNKKKNVLFIILTDGEENSSKEYRLDVIKKLIKEKEEKFNWKFLYLGVDLKNFDDAQKMGLRQYYSPPKKEMYKMYMSISETVSNYIKTGDVKYS